MKDKKEFLIGTLLGLIICMIIILFSYINVKASMPTDAEQAMLYNEITVVSETEIDILAHLVKAEAGNQTFFGKQLVVDVVLNRMRSEKFPDTVEDVIYSPGQFSCSGYFMNNRPSQEDYDAVRTEIQKRQNREVIYFRTKRYGDGTPLFKEDDHYFSKL